MHLLYYYTLTLKHESCFLNDSVLNLFLAVYHEALSVSFIRASNYQIHVQFDACSAN